MTGIFYWREGLAVIIGQMSMDCMSFDVKLLNYTCYMEGILVQVMLISISNAM